MSLYAFTSAQLIQPNLDVLLFESRFKTVRTHREKKKQLRKNTGNIFAIFSLLAFVNF